MSEMNLLISQEKNVRKREILGILKKHNKEAYLHMTEFSKSWKIKYRSLQKTKSWREARLLIKEYFTTQGVLECSVCEQEIKENQSFTLHHRDFYGAPQSYFNPMYCEIIHSKCHKRGDPKKW